MSKKFKKLNLFVHLKSILDNNKYLKFVQIIQTVYQTAAFELNYLTRRDMFEDIAYFCLTVYF